MISTMYAEHNPVIANGMREETAIFMRGVIFTICSIRQPFTSVPDQLEAVDRGDLSPLFGHKLDAHAYLIDNADAMRQSILAAANNGERLEILLRVPGIGLVKGAFVLQLMGYDVACLDSRNIKREGRNPEAFRSRKARTRGWWQKKIAAYLKETEGHARFYWDRWCEDVAHTYKLTAEEVSAMHLAIVPDTYVPF
jgi:hypothetical protein